MKFVGLPFSFYVFNFAIFYGKDFSGDKSWAICNDQGVTKKLSSVAILTLQLCV